MKIDFLHGIVTLSILVKIIFISSVIVLFFLKRRDKKETKLYQQTDAVRKGSDFWFKITMAVLIIYLFTPRKRCVLIRVEERFLLITFGWFLLISEFLDPDYNPFSDRIYNFLQARILSTNRD